MSDEKTDKRKRMMSRLDFKVLRQLSEKITEKQGEFNDAVTKLCDDHAKDDWWPDKVDIGLGFALVKEDRERIPVDERNPIKEISKELTKLKTQVDKRIVAIAIKAGVPTQYVDIGSGEITTERVEECDPTDEKGD